MVIPLSEAVLWDLLVSVNVENAPLLEDENPMVIGTIIDHTSAPVENATIQISSGQNRVFTTTNQTGHFSYELPGVGLLPGEHIVNVVATLGDK